MLTWTMDAAIDRLVAPTGLGGIIGISVWLFAMGLAGGSLFGTAIGFAMFFTSGHPNPQIAAGPWGRRRYYVIGETELFCCPVDDGSCDCGGLRDRSVEPRGDSTS